MTLDSCYVGASCVASVGGTPIGLADLYKTSGCGGSIGCCTTLRDCTLNGASSHITVTTGASRITITSTTPDASVYKFSCKAGLISDGNVD